jgi:hypothetical protein
MDPLNQKQRLQFMDLLRQLTQGLERHARAPLVRAGVAAAGGKD